MKKIDRMKLFKLWLPVIIWAGLIFLCSGIPHLKTDLPQDFLLRKAAHITEYFVLAFLLHRAFSGTLTRHSRTVSFYSAGLCALYAISDEIHQSFVPGRTCALSDVGIDAIGMALFYVFLTFRAKREVPGEGV